MPNLKKLIVIIILGLWATNTFGQSFKNDWKKFKLPNNWRIEFVNSYSNFLESKVQCDLIFKNNIDSNLNITYRIFNDFDVDSAFIKKESRWNFLQSCLSFKNNQSFTFNGYYYLATCNTCASSRVGAKPAQTKNENEKLMTNCEYLNSQILKFVALKP